MITRVPPGTWETLPLPSREEAGQVRHRQVRPAFRFLPASSTTKRPEPGWPFMHRVSHRSNCSRRGEVAFLGGRPADPAAVDSLAAPQ